MSVRRLDERSLRRVIRGVLHEITAERPSTHSDGTAVQWDSRQVSHNHGHDMAQEIKRLRRRLLALGTNAADDDIERACIEWLTQDAMLGKRRMGKDSPTQTFVSSVIDAYGNIDWDKKPHLIEYFLDRAIAAAMHDVERAHHIKWYYRMGH